MEEKTIVVATIGSAGDVHPAIAVARGLQGRGKRVIVAANPHFQAFATDAGLEFMSLGTEEQYERIMEEPDLWHPVRGFQKLAEHVIGPAAKLFYEFVAQFDPRRTLVVASGLLFGAQIAYEKLGTPYMTLHLQPALFRSLYDTPITGGVALPRKMPRWLKRLYFRLTDTLVVKRFAGPPVNTVRQELGLPPQSDFFGEKMHSPLKSVGLFPAWFAPPQPDWPPQATLTGFVRYDRAETMALAPEVVEFLDNGPAPLVFTAGTAMRHAHSFFETSVRAAQTLGRRAIVLALHDEQVPKPLPPGVKHFAYVPFSQLLPHAAALVHHGGIGTVAQALAAGIPQLVMPMSHDQPDNARRLERLGVGETLLPRQYKAETVAEKLSYLLCSEEVAERCWALAKRVDFARALEETCDVIVSQLEMV